MARQIYRQEALERLSSPEQLDLLMPVTSPRGWIALLGVGLLLAIGFGWSIFWTIETTVVGNGLLMRFEGLEWVSAQQAGTVTKMLIKEGDAVNVGDLLMQVEYIDERGEKAVVDISSPRKGRVLDVAIVEKGTFLQGAPLVSVESPEQPLQAVVYIPTKDGYKVHPDMLVKILPVTASGRGAIFLPGKVRSAARFPASRSEMMYSVRNEGLVNNFLAFGPVLEVVIDVTTESPPVHLYSGTPTRASVIVETRRPIQLLVPGFGNE